MNVNHIGKPAYHLVTSPVDIMAIENPLADRSTQDRCRD